VLFFDELQFAPTKPQGISNPSFNFFSIVSGVHRHNNNNNGFEPLPRQRYALNTPSPAKGNYDIPLFLILCH
jgi:hypothetical protein